MKILKISGLLILICLVIFLGMEYFMGEQSDEASGQALTYYQDRISVLESELAAAKTEKYEAIAVYREQIEVLESELTEARGSYTYTSDGDRATLTAYIGTEKNVSLPTEIDGYRVTSIGKETFRNTAVEAVILPSGIESIGWFAFYGCVGLRSIAIPSSVKTIEYGAFDGCTSLVIYCEKGSFAEQYAKSYGIRTVTE